MTDLKNIEISENPFSTPELFQINLENSIFHVSILKRSGNEKAENLQTTKPHQEEKDDETKTEFITRSFLGLVYLQFIIKNTTNITNQAAHKYQDFSLFQLMPEKNGCDLISSLPLGPEPNLSFGSYFNRPASNEQASLLTLRGKVMIDRLFIPSG